GTALVAPPASAGTSTVGAGSFIGFPPAAWFATVNGPAELVPIRSSYNAALATVITPASTAIGSTARTYERGSFTALPVPARCSCRGKPRSRHLTSRDGLLVT